MEDTIYCSKKLSDNEKEKLVFLHLDNKELITDFSYLHDDCYTENEPWNSDEHQIAFFNNNCLWRLRYSFGDSFFLLNCVYEPSEIAFENSFANIKERLFACTEDEHDTPIVSIATKKDRRWLLVYHFALEE